MAIATSIRTIEYPSDLTECSLLTFEGRQLLYICSRKDSDKTPFIVVLGFFLGQKQDFVTKAMIEPVPSAKRALVEQAVKGVLSSEPAGTQTFFL